MIKEMEEPSHTGDQDSPILFATASCDDICTTSESMNISYTSGLTLQSESSEICLDFGASSFLSADTMDSETETEPTNTSTEEHLPNHITNSYHLEDTLSEKHAQVQLRIEARKRRRSNLFHFTHSQQSLEGRPIHEEWTQRLQKGMCIDFKEEPLLVEYWARGFRVVQPLLSQWFRLADSTADEHTFLEALEDFIVDFYFTRFAHPVLVSIDGTTSQRSKFSEVFSEIMRYLVAKAAPTATVQRFLTLAGPWILLPHQEILFKELLKFANDHPVCHNKEDVIGAKPLKRADSVDSELKQNAYMEQIHEYYKFSTYYSRELSTLKLLVDAFQAPLYSCIDIKDEALVLRDCKGKLRLSLLDCIYFAKVLRAMLRPYELTYLQQQQQDQDPLLVTVPEANRDEMWDDFDHLVASSAMVCILPVQPNETLSSRYLMVLNQFVKLAKLANIADISVLEYEQRRAVLAAAMKPVWQELRSDTTDIFIVLAQLRLKHLFEALLLFGVDENKVSTQWQLAVSKHIVLTNDVSMFVILIAYCPSAMSFAWSFLGRQVALDRFFGSSKHTSALQVLKNVLAHVQYISVLPRSERSLFAPEDHIPRTLLAIPSRLQRQQDLDSHYPSMLLVMQILLVRQFGLSISNAKCFVNSNEDVTLWEGVQYVNFVLHREAALGSFNELLMSKLYCLKESVVNQQIVLTRDS